MKMKKLLIVALFIALYSTSYSALISQEEAQKAAVHFYYEKQNQFGDGIDLNDIMITNVYTQKSNGIASFYAFDMNNGFVIVSAEDNYTPIIGYSYSGRFRIDDAPAHIISFFDGYADLIGHIRENNIRADEQTRSEWLRLLNNNVYNLNVPRGVRDVSPLVTTMWDQSYPYNVWCPEDAAGPGGHALAGCVATAMSMVMGYWRYPATGTGYHCYTPTLTYGPQCADYENTEYAWEGMTNSIDLSFPDPNAELQYHAGVSVNMGYGPSGSGAQSYHVPGALYNYFRYEDAEYIEKDDYAQQTWINILKSEIDLGRPMYYSGFSTGGGHAFVCDGYQGNDFHFNFGWSGNSNGYYSLSSVGGFNQGQGIVRYYYPTDNDYPYHNTGDRVISFVSGSITDGSGPVDDYLDNVTASWLIDPQTEQDSIVSITVDFVNFDTDANDVVRVFDGSSASDDMLGQFSGSNLPPSMTSTGNTMLITFTTDASTTSTGWYAEYSAEIADYCNGITTLTDVEATFDDGSGSYFYGNGTSCMWKIEPEEAGNILLSFNAFDTEETYDKLKIFDGGTKIAEFSGDELPDPVTATSGSVTLMWNTSQNNNRPGWEITYQAGLVGLGETTQLRNIAVYPVPSSGDLHIDFTADEIDLLDVKIMTITGIQMYRDTENNVNGTFHNTIDISSWANGVYIVEFASEMGKAFRKLVKQ